MKTIIPSDSRPLLRACYAFLIAIAALWAMPRTAHAQLYVINTPGGGGQVVVSKYNATTGAAINASFITGLINLTFAPDFGLAVSGNTLFVGDVLGFVGKYDATTGGAINASFITGLHDPFGLALLGNTLFVANSNFISGTVNSGTVGEYDATTGAAINASFITGLTVPSGLAVKSAK